MEPKGIGRTHPLRRLFTELVWRRFWWDMGLRDERLAAYASGLLVDFTHADNLYRVRDAGGKRLEDVGEMLLESNPLLGAASFDREREVRRHVGDYTLFMTGIFPEFVAGAQRARAARLDAFVDYIEAGKESYRVVAAFDQFEYAAEAPLYRRLAEEFERCVFGLNLVKQDLGRLERGYYRRLRETLS